jgi:hypothetical protein
MDAFTRVRTVGLTFPDVTAATKYDGSPVLKRGTAFMAGMATDESAEADTIVVRCDEAHRQLLLEEAPETYYITEHYERHPVVLARLAGLDRHALRDLLTMSWRLTASKTVKRPQSA